MGGLYEYTRMYEKTGLISHLAIAVNIAEYYLNHPRLSSDIIPYWNFNAENIPNELRADSAAAISASALITLSKLSDDKRENYFIISNKMIKEL